MAAHFGSDWIQVWNLNSLASPDYTLFQNQVTPRATLPPIGPDVTSAAAPPPHSPRYSRLVQGRFSGCTAAVSRRVLSSRWRGGLLLLVERCTEGWLRGAEGKWLKRERDDHAAAERRCHLGDVMAVCWWRGGGGLSGDVMAGLPYPPRVNMT